MAQIYKIFVRDVPLIIAESEYIPDGTEYVMPEETFSADISGNLNWFLNHKTGNKIFVPAVSASLLLLKIKQETRQVPAAGGLVLNPAHELLMIFRRGKWDLPKGKVDPGEDLTSAALREVMEETGIAMPELENRPYVTYHIYEEKGLLCLKETHWYPMRSNHDETLVPQLSEDITEAVWVSKAGIASKMRNTYAAIHELLDWFMG